MEQEYHLPLAGLLADLLKVFDPAENPVAYNTIRRLLLGAPKAVAAYEARFGPLKALRQGDGEGEQSPAGDGS
jgi:aminopeptidase N